LFLTNILRNVKYYLSQTKKINSFSILREKALEEHELASLLDQLDVSGYVSNELDCIAKGKATGFFVFPAGQREDERVEEFPGWSQRECANFCAGNEV